jgi:2-polyprenyl-3-methyl-5-hydroxy-6-metoxy-1,4-benzoquinol methylase
LPRQYDFITGWDSIWHVPLAQQAFVLQKFCDGLKPDGVLIFTMGINSGRRWIEQPDKPEKLFA